MGLLILAIIGSLAYGLALVHLGSLLCINKAITYARAMNKEF
jgi:hypothetical protein